MEIKLSDDQIAALHGMETGKNCFLTGKAGTGKTTIIETYIKECLDADKSMIVCASTGAAAQGLKNGLAEQGIDVKVCTIHRAFGLKAKPGVIRPPKKAHQEITATDVIIIDEISMARIDLFDYVAKCVEDSNIERKHLEEITAKREGRDPVNTDIQLIVIGDFTQLRPVVTADDKPVLESVYGKKVYAFESQYWKKMNFINLVLQTNHRQADDKVYADHLNEIRECNKTDDPFSDNNPLDWFNLNTATKPFCGKDSVILCGKNATARTENEARLAEIHSKEYYSFAKIEGDADLSSVSLEKELRYKVGSKVIMLVNDLNHEYVNGSFGEIVSCDPDEDTVEIRIFPSGHISTVSPVTCKVSKPVVHDVEKTILTKDETGKPIKKTVNQKVVQVEDVGSVTQYPFKLGWAITIHKSQGMTLKGGVNLYPEIWDSGQLYVALSRVDRADHIFFKNLITDRNWKLGSKVKNFYSKIDTQWTKN